jgi:hypothetical protein
MKPEDEASAVNAAKPKGHAPGESHEFEAICRVCGEHGTVFLAFLGPNEQTQIVRFSPNDAKPD